MLDNMIRDSIKKIQDNTKERLAEMERIIKNAIRCKHCGEVIESKSCHDFVTCKCGCCSVDGGSSYLHRAFLHTPEEDYEEMSESIEMEEKGYK